MADTEGEVGQTVLFDGEEALDRHVGRGEFRGMEFLHVNAKSIINEVPAASRMPFRYTINVYRGCSHACTYCFARPTHEYLGLNIGVDFERRIVVKVNAVERLRTELAGRRWAGHHIAMGTNTDPYQRCEGKYHLTRGVVQVLVAAANPFSILTKSTLILRDTDLLAEAARRTHVRADLSIGTLDEEVWRLTEPGTPAPRLRVDAVRRLNDAGVPCGVLIGPVIPELSDRPEQLKAVVEACVDAGAVSISTIALHLRPGVREHFLGWLASARPELVPDFERRYRTAYLPGPDQRALSATVQRLEETARRALGPAGPGETAELDYTLAQGFRGRGNVTSAQPEPVPPVSAQLDLGV
ncbi:MAG TPA: radical SAM protein [Acidimicrobiales bacterium]|nr:radical SAM protein [Acidimicrobiales bacterium]